MTISQCEYRLCLSNDADRGAGMNDTAQVVLRVYLILDGVVVLLCI